MLFIIKQIYAICFAVYLSISTICKLANVIAFLDFNVSNNVPQGGNWQDLSPELYDVGGTHSNNYRRLHPDKPSITIKHAVKSMIIHPEFDRVVTAREVARLQSIPDSFIIEGNKTDQHQQLANAVPPLLGYEIGKQVLKKLENPTKSEIEVQTSLGDF